MRKREIERERERERESDRQMEGEREGGGAQNMLIGKKRPVNPLATTCT